MSSKLVLIFFSLSMFGFSQEMENSSSENLKYPPGIHVDLSQWPEGFKEHGKIQVQIYVSKEPNEEGRFLLAVGNAIPPAIESNKTEYIADDPRATTCSSKILPGWDFEAVKLGDSCTIIRFCDFMNDPYIFSLFLKELKSEKRLGF